MTIYEIFYNFYTALFIQEVITDYDIIFRFLAFVSSLSLIYLILSWAYSIISRFIKWQKKL